MKIIYLKCRLWLLNYYWLCTWEWIIIGKRRYKIARSRSECISHIFRSFKVIKQKFRNQAGTLTLVLRRNTFKEALQFQHLYFLYHLFSPHYKYFLSLVAILLPLSSVFGFKKVMWNSWCTQCHWNAHRVTGMHTVSLEEVFLVVVQYSILSLVLSQVSITGTYISFIYLHCYINLATDSVAK